MTADALTWTAALSAAVQLCFWALLWAAVALLTATAVGGPWVAGSVWLWHRWWCRKRLRAAAAAPNSPAARSSTPA